MVHTILVLAKRKAGVTREEFKESYERHMRMVTDLCGDAAPLSHTRWYPQSDSSTDKPILLAGDADDFQYAAVLVLEFTDEEAWQKFYVAVSTPEASEKILEDEAGFWEREGMKVMVVEKCGGLLRS